MKTETSKVLALVTAIVLTGVGAVEMTRSPAQANPAVVAGGAAGYAAERVEGAFMVVAELPPVAPVMVPLAMKGDLLPAGCAGPFEPTFAAECIDTAYEVESGPYVVVEARGESTSILTRMMGYTMAGL
ncbi:MAG: hypothetical protein H0T75_14235 [Rhizobiales bacterium]|nr:hypothetical protein [Hyphomicrobiales bacterium]MDQ3559670.1 hypothetical protein [Pseudomonadota bacterium]